jgi:molybdopterin molybdotransferase
VLSFEQAQQRILALAARLGEEQVPAARSAGRVIAQDVRASTDAPAFDASTMDGYAVRAADLAGETLPVVGESRAGARAPRLAPRTACRIFTGAPMPEGADTVVMQEEVTRDADRVTFRAAYVPGTNVRRRGEDLRAGDVALPAGARIGPAQLAMLASLDLTTVTVARQPRVAILATGDELRAPGSGGGSGAPSIPESNSPALAAMAAAAGGAVTVRPPVGDDPGAVRDALGAALASCDVLVTVGGVSVGDHDVVRPALEACGVTLEFWRVAIKPGKPLAVGRRGEPETTIVLGLPGNPVSAMVTFALFGVPLLRALQGDASPVPRASRGRLAAAVRRKAGRLEFARATVDASGAVSLLPQQASGAIVGLCRADALACLPADAESLEAGAEIALYTFAELGL